MSERKIVSLHIADRPYGMWLWRRQMGRRGRRISENGSRIEKWGIVLRFGDMGHIQISEYLNLWTNGRRRKRDWTLSWWGKNGRRGKRGIGIHTFW